MFCGNCGTQNPEGTAFCAGCGAKLNATPAPTAPAPEAPVNQPNPGYTPNPGYAPNPGFVPAPAPKKSKKGLIIGLAVAVVAIVAILLIWKPFGGGASSPESVAKQYIAAMEDCDGEALLKLYHPDYVEEEIGDKDDQKEYAEELETYMAYMEDFDFKLGDVEDVDDDDLEEIQEYFEDEYGLKVKDAKIIVIEYSGEYYGYEFEDEMELYVLKIDGKWYVFE